MCHADILILCIGNLAPLNCLVNEATIKVQTAYGDRVLPVCLLLGAACLLAFTCFSQLPGVCVQQAQRTKAMLGMRNTVHTVYQLGHRKSKQGSVKSKCGISFVILVYNSEYLYYVFTYVCVCIYIYIFLTNRHRVSKFVLTLKPTVKLQSSFFFFLPF